MKDEFAPTLTSRPVDTPAPADPTPAAPVDEPETPEVVTETPEVTEPETAEVVPGEPETPEVPENEVVEPVTPVVTPPKLDAERLDALRAAQTYKPGDAQVDILDEFGNIDPEKFGAFMAQNNESVFNQAVNATKSYGETERIETQAWEDVYRDYPEIAKGSPLETALKGARLQDVIDGGTGDLSELAKQITAPIRDAKIAAVESANKQVTQTKIDGAATPTKDASPEAPATPNNMDKLRAAIKDGRHDEAARIRHAIRRERIFDTTK